MMSDYTFPSSEYAHSYTSPLRAWAASASWTPKFEALSPPSSIDYCHAAAAEMEEEAAGTEATAEITAPRVDPATTTTNAVRESAKDREGTNNALHPVQLPLLPLHQPKRVSL
mmetsp:Transcript_11859/g.25271  ORF Transcript_11859/g.25271 Transcript_11859/m.25271 type:complete len:113 (-) Transcript_11859:414-752(-)